MVVAINVHYKEAYAKTVGVLFNWPDEEPKKILEALIYDVKAYVPGQFYKRELPCIVKILEQVTIPSLDAILVDGYIYTDDNGSYGLGAHLYQHLNEAVPVIGVAKTSFHGNKNVVIPVYRGNSKNPLFVSAIGVDANIIAHHVKQMKGAYRIPAILKELDRLTKEE